MSAATVFDSTLFGNIFGTEEARQAFSERSYVANLIKAECALAEAEEAEGIVPAGTAAVLREHCDVSKIDWQLLAARTEIVGYPVLPLVEQMSKWVPEETSGYIHWGATTQDIMDLASVLQMKNGLEIVERLLRKVTSTLEKMSAAYRDVPMAGRTHLQHALPITFGYKCAVWLAGFRRHVKRLEQIKESCLLVQFGGAAGTLASLGTSDSGIRVRKRLAFVLGLQDPVITWHVARDTVAEIINYLALVGGSLGKIALDLIIMSSNELNEVAEPYVPHRGASSTMPQKRNPISSEVILAQSKILRAQAGLVLDGMVSDFERASGPWHLEWAAIPTAFISIVGSLYQAEFALSGLQINKDAMLTNLNSTRGLIVAEAVMMDLAKYTGRQEAHEIVYKACVEAHESNIPLQEALEKSAQVTSHLASADLFKLCDPTKYLGCCQLMVDELLEQGTTSTGKLGKATSSFAFTSEPFGARRDTGISLYAPIRAMQQRRKIRCYGDGEKCTPCTTGGVACVVSTKLKRNRKRKSYYENEIVDEQRSGSAPARTPDSSSGIIDSQTQGRGQPQVVVAGQSSSQLFPSSIPDRSFSSWSHLPEAVPTVKPRHGHGPEPVVGHMGRLVSNDDQIAMFAGSTTGVHFISQAEQQLQMLRIHTETFPSSVYSLYLHNLWGVPPRESESLMIAAMVAQLPVDAASILEATIDRWTPLYPIVHKHSTLEAFQRLRDDPEHGDISTLYQVLGLLSLGTLGSVGTCIQSHQHFLCLSEKYYAMSATLTSKLHERPCLPTLQGLEIAQIYLQLSSRYSVASQLGGMATRMAQNLGLHRHSQRFKFDPLETELRRRVWWCQYSLDTFSSAYHGMPRLIRDQDVDTDLPSRVDHDQVSRESVAFPLPGERSPVDTALCMFKLAVIVGEALEKLYSTTRRRGGVAKIARLQAELAMWERMLPTDKIADPEDEGAELPHPAAGLDTFEVAFLRAAFCNATVHVHRPALAFTTADPQFYASLQACGRASAELIRLSAAGARDLNDAATTHRMLDAVTIAHLYPNGMHMLWQAGLTILFARWKGQPIGSDDEDYELVATCAATLRRLRTDDANGHIAQCADVLDTLQTKTFSSDDAQAPPVTDQQLQWNVWDWPMASALELANTLDAMPLDLQFEPGLGL